MAKDTSTALHNLVIYSVYVRSHSAAGTFAAVEQDLERIAGMGVDVVWFMPIHPIGQLNKKGSLGCPYSIRDYRAVNPEYGALDDFTRLVQKAHALNLKVMIDVVYNHTAHDSVLVSEHPEYFHQDANGKPVTTVPDWSDVIDLKHPQPGLTRYLIDCLIGWVKLGVDGFRCDVASLLPAEFWLQARAEVAQVKPGVIWLAESVHAGFVTDRRLSGLRAISDSELYQAFDLTYDYDIWPIWQAAVRGDVPPARYLELLLLQDAIYPANYIKMRCVENHDQARIQAIARTAEQAAAWTAFAAFNRGAFMIYGGQETAATHTPSLFEREPIDWAEKPLQPFLTSLARLKKDPALQQGSLVLLADAPCIQAGWFAGEESLYGVFNVTGKGGAVACHLPDGSYTDLLSGAEVTVFRERMQAPASAVILRARLPEMPGRLTTDLLDYRFERV